MPTVSHQTARRSRGSHRNPAGRSCATPTTGVEAEDRDDLYRFASEAVGGRAGTDVTASRPGLCHEAVFECRSGPLRGWLLLVDRMLAISDGRTLTMSPLGDRPAAETVVSWEAPGR